MVSKVEIHNLIKEIDGLTEEHCLLTDPARTPKFGNRETARAAFIKGQIKTFESRLAAAAVTPRDYQMHRAKKMADEIGVSFDAVQERNVNREYLDAFAHWRRTGEDKKIEYRAGDQQAIMWGRTVPPQLYVGGNEITNGVQNSGISGGFTTPSEILAAETASYINRAAPDEIILPGASRIVDTETANYAQFYVADDVVGSGSPVAYSFIQHQILNDTEQIAQGSSQIGFPCSQVYWGKALRLVSAIPMAIELERDASAALAVLLPMVFGQRAALAMSDAAINGGTSNGQTVIGLLSAVAGLPSGNVVTSGSSSSPALIDFQKMLLAMNRAYRRRCAFYMPSSTWLAVSEFLEIAGGARAENQYVGLTGTTLLGRPVYVCDSMAALTSGGIFAVCAVPDLLLQRRVAGGNVIQRIAESSMSDISKGEIALMNVVRWDFYASLDGSNIPPYVAGYLN